MRGHIMRKGERALLKAPHSSTHPLWGTELARPLTLPFSACLLLILHLSGLIHLAVATAQEGFCTADDKECLNTFTLRQIPDDTKTGDEVTITLNDGREVLRKTLNARPKIFEIEDFLTPEESKHLIKIAETQGMESGYTERHNPLEGPQGLRVFDTDGDGQLTIMEMRMTLENNFDIYFKPEDVKKMYKELLMDPNKDDIVTREELNNSPGGSARVMADYVKSVTSEKPWLKGRYSNLSFIFPNEEKDPTVQRLVKRVQALTGIPNPIMEKSDIQVVKYTEKGHYNVHMDSSRKTNVPCCHRFREPHPCRSCRWLTVLFYLNDVEEGGETAFPVAHQDTFDENDFRMNFKMDLHLHCKDMKVAVKPKTGKAVMWYNHENGEGEEYVGPNDLLTHHGSCPVRKGKKWIANFWIKFTDDRAWDLTPLAKLGFPHL